MDDHPVERFDPLLRNLLAWHLVEELPDGGWRLRHDVGQRLGTLARLSRRDDPSEVLYFGHTCAGCQKRGLTRLRDGRYLCDACRHTTDLAAVATRLPVSDEQKRVRRGVLDRVRTIAS